MKKIIVIGCPGSGKSTFSKALHKIIGIPLYILHLIFWNNDKTNDTNSVLIEKISDITNTEDWIIDGNYSSTMELRMKECDTVIFLDYHVEVCLSGINERKGKSRSDMPWFESDEQDAEFIDYIKNFSSQSRPQIMELLKKYSSKNIFIFKSRQEADEFLLK